MIAHWPGLPAKLSGKVIGIEHGKYYVEYDDGDKHHNTIDQLRILKPPMYFGKRASVHVLHEKNRTRIDQIKYSFQFHFIFDTIPQTFSFCFSSCLKVERFD